MAQQNPTSISIPIQGDKNTVKAVKRIARLEDKTMAEVVYEAMLAKHGERFTDLIESYRAGNDHNSIHTDMKQSA